MGIHSPVLLMGCGFKGWEIFKPNSFPDYSSNLVKVPFVIHEPRTGRFKYSRFLFHNTLFLSSPLNGLGVIPVIFEVLFSLPPILEPLFLILRLVPFLPLS